MDFDLLVATNPVWETSWLLPELPIEAVPEGIRGAGETAPAWSLRALDRVEDGGGSALNTACALACAGRRVLAVGRVGDDTAGANAIEALRRRGIETRIEVAAARATKRNHLFVERGTHRTAFQVILPQRSVPPWDEEPPYLDRASILLLDRMPAGALAWLRARRTRPGLRNSLNRNSGIGTPAAEERFAAAYPLLDLLQLPEREDDRSGEMVQDRRRIHQPAPFPYMTDQEARRILGCGVAVLLRTQGPRGILVQTLERRPDRPEPVLRTSRIPAKTTDVLDPTGAGDAFAAGLLDGLLSDLDLTISAERGADWAARACRHLGARGWLDREPPP